MKVTITELPNGTFYIQLNEEKAVIITKEQAIQLRKELNLIYDR